jgi:peptidoglycan/LPS O-acetylase OafA/YrhL
MSHFAQVDLVRIVPMIGVVSVHTLIFTQPADSIGANALLMLLHANREIFFFITAFLLFHSTRDRDLTPHQFWRRRYPLVVAPYLAWTLIYWVQTENGRPWPAGPALSLLWTDLSLGWFHLYFLLVTMQLYLVFPVLRWLIIRTRGHHRWLLAVSVAVQIAFMAAYEYGGPLVPGLLQLVFAYAQVELTSYQLAFIAGVLAADHVAECLEWMRRHGRLLLGLVAGGVVAAELVYTAGLAAHWLPPHAADVFQPGALLGVTAALIGLFLLADQVVHAYPQDGRLWRGLRAAARASFGVYLGHMLPLQLLLLTPAAALIGLIALPLPLRALAVLGIVLAVTFGMVLALQRTPLSLVLTGRPRPVVRSGRGPVEEAAPASLATRRAG